VAGKGGQICVGSLDGKSADACRIAVANGSTRPECCSSRATTLWLASRSIPRRARLGGEARVLVGNVQFVLGASRVLATASETGLLGVT